MLLKELHFVLFEITLAEARDRVHSYVYTIVAHTLKILLYSQHRDANHWRDEINGYFELLTRRKLSVGNRKPPSGALIVDWMNEVITPQYINKVYKEVIAHYGTPEIQISNLNSLWQQAQQAYVAIADKREDTATALSKIKV